MFTGKAQKNEFLMFEPLVGDPLVGDPLMGNAVFVPFQSVHHSELNC